MTVDERGTSPCSTLQINLSGHGCRRLKIKLHLPNETLFQGFFAKSSHYWHMQFKDYENLVG